MRKTIGLAIVILLVLASLLPIWSYSYPILKTYEKEIQGWDREGNQITITTPQSEGWIYETKYTWWLLAILNKDSTVILGEVVGYIGLWTLGIWLIKKGSKKQGEVT